MAGCIVAKPSANIAGSATPSWSVGTANASYPVTNVITTDPGTVAKANETTASLRLTWGGSKTLKALALINTNLGGKTLTLSNNGGMTPQTVTVPSNADGLLQNCWFDLRDVANNAATQWTIAVTGASAAVAIGTVLALDALLEPHVKWSYDLGQRVPAIVHRSSMQHRFAYDVPVRTRPYEGRIDWAEDYTDLTALLIEARKYLPFFLVVNEDEPDASLVQFADDEVNLSSFEFFTGEFHNSTVDGIVAQTLRCEEVNAGVAL